VNSSSASRHGTPDGREPPRVSVVTPVYNGARFLAEAVASVLAQTYESWELLLIDDGSIDGSRELAERYAAEHPGRIRSLHHPGHENRGAAASRNMGIAHARGEYLALLDADDVWLPHKLVEQVALLDAHPDVSMVYGSADWWYSWTGTRKDRARDRLDSPGFPSGQVIEPPLLLQTCLRERAPMPLPTTVLLRREAVEAMGGFEDTLPVVYDDQAFFTKLLLVGRVLPFDTSWARYRRHPDSSCAAAARTGETEALAGRYLAWAEHYLEEHGWRGTPVWNALRLRIWKHRHPRLAGIIRQVKHALRTLFRFGRT